MALCKQHAGILANVDPDLCSRVVWLVYDELASNIGLIKVQAVDEGHVIPFVNIKDLIRKLQTY